MTEYAFVTRWSFAAPIDEVWKAISEPERWPDWWRGVERVELLAPGEKDGTGSLRRFTWKSPPTLPAGVRHEDHPSSSVPISWKAGPRESSPAPAAGSCAKTPVGPTSAMTGGCAPRSPG
jgi:hypothetical protein